MAAAWRRLGGRAQHNGSSVVAAAWRLHWWRQGNNVTSAAAWRRCGSGGSATAQRWQQLGGGVAAAAASAAVAAAQQRNIGGSLVAVWQWRKRRWQQRNRQRQSTVQWQRNTSYALICARAHELSFILISSQARRQWRLQRQMWTTRPRAQAHCSFILRCATATTPTTIGNDERQVSGDKACGLMCKSTTYSLCIAQWDEDNCHEFLEEVY